MSTPFDWRKAFHDTLGDLLGEEKDAFAVRHDAAQPQTRDYFLAYCQGLSKAAAIMRKNFSWGDPQE